MSKQKIILSVIAIILSTGSGFAQKDKDAPGKDYISIGVGFPNLPKYIINKLNVFNNVKSSGSGPFHLKYENRIKPWLGVGISINHMTYKFSYTQDHFDTVKGVVVPNNIEVSSKNTAFNLRANFHFLNPEKFDKFDAYVGFGLGYRAGKPRITTQYQGTAPSVKFPFSPSMGAEFTLGMRYFFSDYIGLYTELGIAKSIIQAGLTARF